jgi:hypothetical protein
VSRNSSSVLTRHLTPDEFVDLLDGRSREIPAGHLAACEACQRQLTELRQAWEAAVSVPAPEPSPLFWDHLSARVRAAVAEESAPRRPWWVMNLGWRSAMLAAVGAAAALIIAVNLGGPGTGDVRFSTNSAQATMSVAIQPSMPSAAPSAADAAAASLDDDEPLALMVDLASEVDWDSVDDVTLAARGGADRLIVDMSDDERAELQRMLKEALDSGA